MCRGDEQLPKTLRQPRFRTPLVGVEFSGRGSGFVNEIFLRVVTNYSQVITTQEIKHKELWSHCESPTWRDVRANIKQDIIEEVREKLRVERIGENNSKDQLETAIDWRMRQVFKRKRSRLEDKDGKLLLFVSVARKPTYPI